MDTKHPFSHPIWVQFVRLAPAAVLITCMLFGSSSKPFAFASSQTNISGPAGSGEFGQVTVLPNGNFVVLDPKYDAPGPIPDVGAAYLYSASGELISTLTGANAGDQIGSDGTAVLSNGNYGVISTHWSSFSGAVTWGDRLTGVSGAVSAANSLVGSTPGDQVGSYGVMALGNGNHLVVSPKWHHGAAASAGAVTWVGATGVSGAVSAANSLVGSTAGDEVGCSGAASFPDTGCSFNGVSILSNGNYLVVSTMWDNVAAVDAGAVTWGNGATGVMGTVSAANSLVGSMTGDRVGSCHRNCLTALSSGNYLVASYFWHNHAGAVTFLNGSTGRSGVVSADNSLVGSSQDDNVGDCSSAKCVTELSNGNYVVASRAWDNGAAADAGAVTWGNGMSGVSGAVSEANSLVGSTAGDGVGKSVTALSTGNYVVTSDRLDNGAAVDAGAVTWGDGAIGTHGVVSALNSLIGSSTGDRVGCNNFIGDDCEVEGITVLNNGNYVVASPRWSNGSAAGAGAATWGNGMSGVSGAVSEANSLVGSTMGDAVGKSVTALTNGNYVVVSPAWDNGKTADTGAATWGDGAIGISGEISTANSLVGSQAADQIGQNGYGGVTALHNGNYVVASSEWHNSVGAVTWGNGAIGTSGLILAANSLVGSVPGDFVGAGRLAALSNGNYVVLSPWWHNGTEAEAGAVTWGNGALGLIGTVSAANSLVGTSAGDRVGHCYNDYPCIFTLSSGNYVVTSPDWHGVGAVTWGDGTNGLVGAVSAANSLVGSTPGDAVGFGLLTVLENGNYLIASPYWDNGAASNAGAMTWGSGISGVHGVVSAANSLVGSTTGDIVGYSSRDPENDSVIRLSNGNYLVTSPNWHNGASAAEAGAVTWGNGTTGVSGTISAANSLVGTMAGDNVGAVSVLLNGNYVVTSPAWDNGVLVDAGAISLGAGAECSAGAAIGSISSANSVLGTAAGGGGKMNSGYDPIHHQLVVGRPADNIVSLYAAGDCAYHIFVPVIGK